MYVSFEMKCRHPEQKLGDCFVSLHTSFTSVRSCFFLPREILYLVSRSKYRTLSYSGSCDSTDERQNGSQEQRLREVVNVKTTSGTRFGKARSFSLDNVAY